MNRSERRARTRQQAKTAVALNKRAGRAGSAAEALKFAQRLFRLGRSAEALPGLGAAVAAYPDDSDLLGALAYALAAAGDFGPAIEHYRALLAMQPDSVPVLTNLAFLLAQTGRADEARDNLERASALAPQHANTAYTLAELASSQRRTGEAFQHYQRAARLFRRKIGPNPEIQHCDDLVKLAIAQLWTGEIGAALHNLDTAIELRPTHLFALVRRGWALAKLRRFPEAIATLRRAAAVAPNLAELRVALGQALRDAGYLGAAATQYRSAVRLDSTDELARFLLASVQHESVDAPPLRFIRGLFDDYADRFDKHLVDILQYRAPEQVCAAVLDLAGIDAADWRVVDVGCGTGLCGPLIRHAARHLTGIDLSAGMIDKARKKSVYDALIVGDAAQVLAGFDCAFDVALCTDVMIYLGNLAPIFAAVERAIVPGGLFAFTTEVHTGEGFVLDHTSRYLHSRGYVESVAAGHGFLVVRFEEIVARYEHHKPDIHHLWIAKRTASAETTRVVERGEADAGRAEASRPHH